jgi:hypothetical protein
MYEFMQAIYMASPYGVVAFTIFVFIKGLRIAQRYQDEEWKRQWRQAMRRIERL